MSESELLELKEQIKREILKEINTKKENENMWSKIKKEYEEEFKKITNKERDVYVLQGAIGTLLRVIYKTESVLKINAEYEEMKEIVEKILNILKEKVGVKNEML